MSLLKTNEIQNYNGSSLTLTASTVSTSAQLNTGGNISVTGSLNVSDDSTTRTNLGLGSIATQAADNVTITGGNISNATLQNTVTLTDNYYLQAKLNSSFAASALPQQIYFDEATAPFWAFTSDSDWHVSGTDSNFSQGTTTSDLKIHRAGIYLINFSVTGYETNAERALDIRIRGVGSGSTNELSRSLDNIAVGDSGTNYGNAACSLVFKFNANDQINFYLSSASDNSANLYIHTHFNMCLIRPL